MRSERVAGYAVGTSAAGFAKLVPCASAKSFTPFRAKAGSSARRRYLSALRVATCAAFGATRLTLRGGRKDLHGRWQRFFAGSTSMPRNHVVITGGEPMLAPEIEDLTTALRQRGKHVTIETAGTIFKPVALRSHVAESEVGELHAVEKTKGKFAAMHEQRRLNFAVLQNYLDAYDYQLKFVVDGQEDFAEIRGHRRPIKECRCRSRLDHGAGNDAKTA